jgi:hypothetical protein
MARLFIAAATIVVYVVFLNAAIVVVADPQHASLAIRLVFVLANTLLVALILLFATLVFKR